jgi:excisionase family DNA binding protein
VADITPANESPFPKAVRRRSKPYNPVAPLALPPLEVARLLSCGLGHIYNLMSSGELESFSSGRARRVTTKSLEAYVARQLTEANNKACDPAGALLTRRRGPQQRPRKSVERA